MGPGHSSSLRIGRDSSIVSDSGQASGASDRLAGVAFRDALGEPPLLLDKGKGRIDEVKYPPSSQLCSGSATKAKDSSGKAVEPPLEVMPITVWSPPA